MNVENNILGINTTVRKSDLGDRLSRFFQELRAGELTVTPSQQMLVVQLAFEFAEQRIDRNAIIRLRNRIVPILAGTERESTWVRHAFNNNFTVHTSALPTVGLWPKRADGQGSQNGDTTQYGLKKSLILWCVFLAAAVAIFVFISRQGSDVTSPLCPEGGSECETIEPTSRTFQTRSENSSQTVELDSLSDTFQRRIVATSDRVRNVLDPDQRVTLAQFARRIYPPTSDDPRRWVRFLRQSSAELGIVHDQEFSLLPAENEISSSEQPPDLSANFVAIVGSILRFEGWDNERGDISNQIAATLRSENFNPIPSQAWIGQKDDELSPSTLYAPGWLSVVLVLIPLLFGAFWLSRSRDRIRKYLQRRMPNVMPIVQQVVVSAANYKRQLFQNSRQAAKELNQHERVLTKRLDVEKTISATIENGGWFDQRYQILANRPEYLIILSRYGSSDQNAKRIDDFVAMLSDEDIQIDRYFMDENTNILYQSDAGRRISLSQLHDQYPDHRLIFVGTGNVFFRPGNLRPWQWSMDLQSWRQKAFLTPVPVERWGKRELAMSKLFSAFPLESNFDGFKKAGEILGSREIIQGPIRSGTISSREFSWEHRPERWLSQADLTTSDWNDLHKDLMAYFGPGESEAIEWLCCCAIYPEIRWDLALYLGLKLRGASNRIYYTEARASKLTDLPWFRKGYMPNPVRQQLLDHLKSNYSKGHRQAVLEIAELLRGVSGDQELDEQESIALSIGSEPQSHLRRKITKRRQLRDMVMIDRLAQEEVTDLVVEASPSLISKLQNLKDSHVLHELAKLSAFVIYALIVAVLVPWPIDGPLTAHPWTPVISLIICTAVGILIYWLQRTSKSKQDSKLGAILSLVKQTPSLIAARYRGLAGRRSVNDSDSMKVRKRKSDDRLKT